MQDLAHWFSSLWPRALAAGAAYAALAVLGGAIVASVGRLVGGLSAGRWSWLDWDGWGFLSRMAGALIACAALLSALYFGFLSPVDVGMPIRLSYWSSSRWAWSGSLAFAGIVVIWGARWLFGRPRDGLLVGPGRELRWAWPAHAIAQEAALAIARAALAPAFGAAWAPWLGAACKNLLAAQTPQGRRAWVDDERRPWLLLDMALDWIATASMVATGSVGWGLLLRAVGLSVCVLVYGALAPHRAPEPVAPTVASSLDSEKAR
jgi:hypothetical protein